MPTDTPSNLPPVLRPENPPARSLAELAERFGRDVRGEVADVQLNGVTLATADLRAGEAFVAIQGVNRHGAEFAPIAAEKGAVAIVTDAAGADLAESAGLPVVGGARPGPRRGARPSDRVGPRPEGAPRGALGLGVRHGAGRRHPDPLRHDRHE